MSRSPRLRLQSLIQAAAVTLLAASAAHAQQAVQWRVEDGGNGHWYQLVVDAAGLPWPAARQRAQAMGADLAVLSRQGSTEFVQSLLASTMCGGSTGQAGPYVGGFQDLSATDYAEPAGGWRWVDGSPFPGSALISLDDNLGHQDFLHFISLGSSCDGPFVLDDVGLVSGANRSFLVEWSADCNADGIIDYGQILAGQLPDANFDGVPDSCETLRVPEDFATIQAAVNAAVNGVTISVAAGSYAPFNFNGKRITVQGTKGASATTIDASGQNVSAVVFGVGASFDTKLRGFTIKTGNAGGGGGVLLNGNGTPAGNCDGTIEDCRFIRGAGSVGYGGGLYAECGNVVVRRCVFDGLYAEHFHGAMGIAMTDYSSVPGMPGVGALIEDCEFRNCRSWNNGALGIRGIQSAKAVLRRVLFTGNVSPFSTGALLTGSPGLDGTPTPAVLQLDIDHCVFAGNSGPFSAGISEGIPLPGQFTPMTINVTGSIFADSGTSIVTRGSTQLRIQGTRFCAGAGAIGSPYADFGANEFSCAAPTDCDSDGVPDAFGIVLGRVADFDANGVPDVCQQPTCVNADIHRDFNVNGGDLGVLLFEWGPSSPTTRSDIDGDGTVDGTDLGLLLSFWGACP